MLKIIIALTVLKDNGCMILRQNTFFETFTINIYALLSNIFEQVNICKPISSNCTTSETFLVCKNLTGKNEKKEVILNILKKKINIIKDIDKDVDYELYFNTIKDDHSY